MSDITLPAPLLVASHLAAGALGWAMCYLITLQAGESAHPSKKGPPMRHLHVRLPILVIVVALVVLIGIGIQSALYMRYQSNLTDELRQRDTCITDWASRFTESLDARTDQNVELESAREKRDKANARVLLIVLDAQGSEDPEGFRERFNKALASFARASATYDEVKRQTTKVRNQNPYPAPPDLICGGDE